MLYFLLGIVTVALAVFGGHVSSDNLKHRIGFYVLGGISVVLIFFTGLRNYEAQTRLDKSIDSLQKSSEAIANMSKETVRIGQLNTQLQERLLEQSKTITNLSKQSINIATGGNSFGYIIPLNICTSDRWIPTFIQKGKYPLYEVEADIVDLAKFRKILESGLTWLNYSSASTVINIGNTVEGHGRSHLGKELPIARDGKEHAYNVFIFARNGYWDQQLKVINVNGECFSATRVYKDKKLIYEHIPDNFRKNYNGEINWSNH